MHRKDWAYKQAIVKTKYKKNVPRTELKDSSTGVIWLYHKEAWDDRIVKTGLSTCWEWQGSFHRQGLGLFSVRRENDESKTGMMNVQRLAKAIEQGRPLKNAERVFATCNNPTCTNPAHIQIGNRSECQQNRADVSDRQRKWSIDFIDDNIDLLLTEKRGVIAKELGVTLNQAMHLKFQAGRRLSGEL